MTEPDDLVSFHVEDAPRPKVRVPIRFGDGIFTFDEYAEVDADAARQYDATQWHDRPPL